ncbi:MAG: nucleotidyltransferase family protein [Planctomyces sp.]|nr:nucleotidyltransferase family protein [Planctomyces sp.]
MSTLRIRPIDRPQPPRESIFMHARTFALVPAAGHSRRMGRQKLLLPAGEGRTVIRALLDSLHGVVAETWVLVRADDVELQRELQASDARVVAAEDNPPEMRDSVERLLREIERESAPTSEDAWLLIPADHPVLNRETLLALLREQESRPEAIHVPTHHGRRGHPTLFPWGLAAEVFTLPEGEGVNALLRRPAISLCEHAVDDPAVLWDLDTPEDYERLLQQASLSNLSPRS